MLRAVLFIIFNGLACNGVLYGFLAYCFYDPAAAAGRAVGQRVWLGVYHQHSSDAAGLLPGLIHAFWVQSKS
jgi:hypothetical protein